MALILLRNAMDRKLPVKIHNSINPLPAKPGEKTDLFVLFLVLKLLGRASPVRAANGNMKRKVLSWGETTP